jgi:Ribbon-helix-helix protein, copG family
VSETEPRTITFKLPAEEADALDARASQAGVSRSDYLRTLLAAPPAAAPPPDLQEILHYLVYMIENLHLSTYLIAEKSGALLPEQLQEILKEATGEAAFYMSQLDQHFTRLAKLVATFRNGTP